MKPYLKKIENYKIMEEIGKGSFGTVYLSKAINDATENGREIKKDADLACKVIPIKHISSKSLKNYISRELEILFKTNHENVISHLSSRKTNNNIYVFTEFCNGGDLSKFVEIRGGTLCQDLIKIIIKQIAQGLNYLNSISVIHRDLKLENILIHFPNYEGEGVATNQYKRDFDYTKDQIKVVIGDLGFAVITKEGELKNSCCGTKLYMAPEVMNKESYSSNIDIWSFGVILYRLIVGDPPFSGNNETELKRNIENGEYGIPKIFNVSYDCFDLINSCLQFDPEKRINYEEILAHPFLNTDDEASWIDCEQYMDLYQELAIFKNK